MTSETLKALISKKSLGDSSNSQQLFQMFYFERILERISISRYKGQIILKGGLLLSSMLGVDERTTKDMDATLKGIAIKEEVILKVFNEILSTNLDDNVRFKIENIKDIRQTDEYGGFRLNILGTLDTNKTYLSIDLTVGDIITPKEVKYSYKSIFGDKKIIIMAYTIETILAEKFETIMRRSILNTRMKDFGDIYFLMNNEKINIPNLRSSIKKTFLKRNTKFDLNEFRLIILELKEDKEIINMWNKFQKKIKYINKVKFIDAVNSVEKIIDILENN